MAVVSQVIVTELLGAVRCISFILMKDAQMISLADVFVYNVYRQFRETDPTYSYFARLRPQIIELIQLPENKKLPRTGSFG